MTYTFEEKEEKRKDEIAKMWSAHSAFQVYLYDHQEELEIDSALIGDLGSEICKLIAAKLDL